MTTKLKENERLDDLQIKNYKIIQHPGKFCFGMDAVLLSSFATLKEGAKVLDLGTGTGIIPILLAAKSEGTHFSGLEIQKDIAEMAGRSISYNHLDEKIAIVTGDIKEAANIFGHASFDIITVNPPYMIGAHGLQNRESTKAIARHEVLCTLEDIIRQSAKILVPKGKFFMVHRPFRLAEILIKMSSNGIEPKRIRFVHPYLNKEPNMVLIEGMRGAKPRMIIDPPLIVYHENGTYTKELLQMYGEQKSTIEKEQ